MITQAVVAIALVAAVYVGLRLFGRYPRPETPYEYISAGEAHFLQRAAEAMFPSGGAIPLSGADADLPGFADRYLASLHPRVRMQIHLLLTFFEQATIFFPAPGRGGHRRFSGLALEQRIEVLHAWSESQSFLRSLVFTALRAVLTMGYLGHPVPMRHLRLAPLDFESPVLEVDLLYPPIGKGPESIRYTRADLTPPSDGTPLDPHGPFHPDYHREPS